MYRNPERRQGHPPVVAVRRERGKLIRIPLIDLSITGEGQAHAGPIAPVDAERLLREVRAIQASNKVARTVGMLRPGRVGARRYPNR